MPRPVYDRLKIRKALELLQVDRLVLAIHDASFPSMATEELGRGSPYGLGGRAFLRFAHELGFDTLQLGPQGQTSRINPSPYDGSVFSRTLLSLAPTPLVQAGLLGEAHLERLVKNAPVCQGGSAQDRVDYAYAFNATLGLLDGALAKLRSGDAVAMAIRERFEAYLASNLSPGSWLERDALFAALASQNGTDDWRLWPRSDATLYQGDGAGHCGVRMALANGARVVERHAFGQFLLQAQHDELRKEAAQLHLELLADLQVGYSHQDRWAWGAVFLPNYAMGAPPSRTTPAGQPWGYPVLDPDQIGTLEAPGAALALVGQRVRKLLGDFDGIRIDHPHGLVCPWVYHFGTADPFEAVRAGARLYESPALPDHPALARHAIATSDQLNPDPATPRHADDWVLSLQPQQVTAYARVLDLILTTAREAGRSPDMVLCEVLSTWPRPLREVMQQRQLGRFCVTQKTNPLLANDLYRSESLDPQDWIMVGNHDTPPVWKVVQGWQGTAHLEHRAHHLAACLCPAETDRHAFAQGLMANPKALCNALFAELFACRARNVSVFFADLLGLEELYNRPGQVDEQNWTLRVHHDYAARYQQDIAQGAALDLRRALALALRKKCPSPEGRALAEALEAEAGPLPPPASLRREP